MVTVTGSNFPSSATVIFGNTAAADVVIANSTLALVTTPAHAEGTVDVILTDPDGQSATVSDAFTFVAPPILTALTPDLGPAAGGTEVTLAGTGFQSGATVLFGDGAASIVTVSSATSAGASTPQGSAGPVEVVFTNPDGQSSTLFAGYTYAVPPSITSVSPESGSAAGGTAITVTGTDFEADALVTIGVASATDVVVSATSITAVTQAGSPGAAEVVVINPDGLNAALPGGFIYVTAPTVAAVAPDAGPAAGGTEVEITGTGFQTGATVTFNGIPALSPAPVAGARVIVNSATSITATTPSGTAGAADVVVTNPDTQTATLVGGFTYVRPSGVMSVSPTSGSTAGGTVVTITGTDYVSGATVTVGGAAATNVVFGSATSITATTPSGMAGAVDVVVTNPDTQADTLASGYSYVLTPDLTQLPMASGQLPQYAAYDLLNVGSMASGGQYADPLTGVLVTKITDSSAPYSNTTGTHGYSNGPDLAP